MDRCDKAISDNIKSQFFKDTPFSSIKLCAAYKIENSQLLKQFEKNMKNSENSVLKGLFLSVSKKQLPSLLIFGLQNSEFLKNQGISYYFHHFYIKNIQNTKKFSKKTLIKVSKR